MRAIMRSARREVKAAHQGGGAVSTANDAAPAGLRFGHHTFFGAPPRGSGRGPAGAAFLGVPFDLGTTLRPGARFGPGAVRAASAWWQYARDEGTDGDEGRAEGWYDLDRQRWILRGVTMADWGDVRINPVEIEANLDRISAGVRAILRDGSFPVIVGGDHAIIYPAVRAFAANG